MQNNGSYILRDTILLVRFLEQLYNNEMKTVQQCFQCCATTWKPNSGIVNGLIFLSDSSIINGEITGSFAAMISYYALATIISVLGPPFQHYTLMVFINCLTNWDSCPISHSVTLL